MPLPVLFGPLTNPTLPQLDQNFAALAEFVTIAGTLANSSNAFVLTPVGNAPTVGAYVQGQSYAGIAPAGNTGPATFRVAPNPVLPIYVDTASGPQPLSGNEIVDGNYTSFIYDLALNSGSGGFHLGQSVDISGVSLVNVKSFGAVGDGVNDDTAALQNAINFGFNAGINVYIPFGIYKTTAMLTVGALASPGNVRSGWKLYGDGPGGNTFQTEPGAPGSCIQLYGSGIDSVLQIGSSAFLICTFEDFALETNTSQGATYGLSFNSTEFSRHTVSRVSVQQNPATPSGGPDTAFAILQGTGANGEFVLFSDCSTSGANKFFYSNAGQALVQRFDHCQCLDLNNGGTHFLLDNFTVEGGGLVVVDYNAGAVQVSGVSNTTLLAIGNAGAQANNSPVTFVGGRVEHVTQLYAAPAGTSPGLGTNVSFRGMEIGVDYDPTNGALTKTAFIATGGNSDNVTGHDCRIFADQGSCSFPISGLQWSRVKFKDCAIVGFQHDPYIVQTLPVATNGGFCHVRFEDCIGSVTGSGAGANLPFTLNLNWELNVNYPGKRSIAPDNAWAQSGLPQNFLVHPEIGPTNSSGTPTSPWVLTGAATMGIFDWNGGTQPVTNGGTRPRSSSPFARVLYLPTGATLYQDIAALDLSTTTYATLFEATYVNTPTAVMHLANLTNSAGYIQIVDSVSGADYSGQQTFPNLPNSASYTCDQIITLSTRIVQTGSTSYPRLKIVNTGPNTLIIDLVDISVFVNLNGALGPMIDGSSFSDEWGCVADNIMARSRLQLPSKSSAFGAAPTLNAQPNLMADIYYDTTTGRIQYFDQNTAVWKYLTGTNV